MVPPTPAGIIPLPAGLAGDEARRRLEQVGPNAIPDTALRPWRRVLAKFWAPVPWLLEAAVVDEAASIDVLCADTAFAVVLDLAKVPLFARLQIT
jgi:magnesium-transporting ATPase (P-type)